MQRLYDRYDLLCDACRNLQSAAEAIKQCRDVEQAECLAALEQIGDALSRDRDTAHAKLERMAALEQAALARETRE